MTNIANLVISEDIYSDENKELLIYKPVGKIYVDPSPSQKLLYFTFLFINLDSRQNHHFTIFCSDPNDEIIWQDEFVLEDQMGEDVGAKQNAMTASAAAKELEFHVEGTYLVTLQHKETEERKIAHFDVEFIKYTLTVSETEEDEE